MFAENDREIYKGILQGSKLGPLIFIFFINDLFKLGFKGNIQMYADDIILYYDCYDLDELRRFMQHDMDLLYLWLGSNDLELNINKTKYMVFRSKKADYHNNNQEFQILYNGLFIERRTSQKYLGLIIDDKLNWNEHVDSVKKAILPYLFAIKRTSKYVDQKVLWMVYNSDIMSRLSFLSPIWMSAPQYKLNELKTLQYKVVKSIKSLHWRHPTHDLYAENLLSIEVIKT